MHRRLARDYQTLTASSEATIHIASVDNLARRITDETTPPPVQCEEVVRIRVFEGAQSKASSVQRGGGQRDVGVAQETGRRDRRD